MIVRLWRGATRTTDRASYLDYLEKTGLRSHRQVLGNMGALVLTREVRGITEFLVLSFWESADAVRGLVERGSDWATLHPADAQFLVEGDLQAQQYEVSFFDPRTHRPRL